MVESLISEVIGRYTKSMVMVTAIANSIPVDDSRVQHAGPGANAAESETTAAPSSIPAEDLSLNIKSTDQKVSSEDLAPSSLFWVESSFDGQIVPSLDETSKDTHEEDETTACSSRNRTPIYAPPKKIKKKCGFMCLSLYSIYYVAIILIEWSVVNTYDDS